MSIPKQIQAFLRKYGLDHGRRTLLVAVSGGPDSVCLLHALCQTAVKARLHVVHIDHQLRAAESDGDAEYVQVLSASLDVPLTIRAVDVMGHRRQRRFSIEEAARDLRYAAFAAMAQELDAQLVLLGHNGGDQAETVLMNLLRGAGTAGLRGMEPLSLRRQSPLSHALRYGDPSATQDDSGYGQGLTLARPLLGTARSEIEEYCATHGLQPRTDSSNLTPEFTRNRIRRQLWPELLRFNPRVEEALQRLANSSGEVEDFLASEVEECWPKVVEAEGEDKTVLAINKAGLAELQPAVATHLLRRAILTVRGSLKGITSEHLLRLRDLASKPAGKQHRLPGGPLCWTEYGRLCLRATAANAPAKEIPRTPLKVPGVTELIGWHVRAVVTPGRQALAGAEAPLTAIIDAGLASSPLWIRSRQAGDRFQPMGMRGSKKLQDFLVDAKVPRNRRDGVPLLCGDQGVLWVVGHRLSEQARLGPYAQRTLRLEFTQRA